MKHLSGIKILIYLSMGLLTSFASENNVSGVLHEIVKTVSSDTTIANQYIKVDSFNLSIIPPSSGVQFYKDGIIFLASTKSYGKILPDHLSFGKVDTRYSVLKNSILEVPLFFSPSSSFPYPSEAITFSSGYNTIYFTKISKSDGCEKIYRGKYSAGNPGEWSFDPNPLSFCSDKSAYTHPALSANGKLMIFASNRSGSLGGMDLYVSIEKNGTWSDPVNLGDAVNSSSNELYPFLDPENNLFFSSDNIQGYGGYDIYVCKFKSNTWEKPINLSTPVNTRFDDVAFTIDIRDGKSAFYTVKQNAGKRSVQLHKVTIDRKSQDAFLTLSQFYTRPDISHMVILALEPAVQATDDINETVIPKKSESVVEKDNLVYRVQFLTSFNPNTRSQITVSGKDYRVFEYLNSGAYRLCAGEFISLAPAFELQNLLRKNDYPAASVVVIKNGVLSFDPQLLKNQTVLSQVDDAEQKTIFKLVPGAKPSGTIAGDMKKDIKESEAKKGEPVKTGIPEPGTKKIETVKAAITGAAVKKDIVLYRVQIVANTRPKGSYNISIAGKSYKTYEYFYNGAYRSTVGELSTLVAAKEFLIAVKRSGYLQAFVVAFKNNIRSNDPELFR